MGMELWLTLAVLAGAVYLFVTEKLPVDVVDEAEPRFQPLEMGRADDAPLRYGASMRKRNHG